MIAEELCQNNGPVLILRYETMERMENTVQGWDRIAGDMWEKLTERDGPEDMRRL